ncbi:3-hydroxyisobutyrate dehydrogenase [Humidesulfovibrio mexicanus]|uniref:3-hydroxyisobutyrate dehydrogenase n=1 Tax=Humidesulfovibrio mexicanus TaxID=147047 RepID=A0A238YS80_9BACT|nr:NAD(P)-dependent oxidoreductase [Humidesulfovibrio mexicanus]SNR74126.1 3-hydroxyisobutyrate dehydrogenase [Humidesulfovibrio mexicanus]
MNPTPTGTTSTRIGWIGTGVMGLSMCGHLMAAGHPATVFNRTEAKARPLLDKGAAWAESPRAVAEASDVVFTIVGYPDDVRRVYFEANGVLAGLKPGTIAVDMTTTSPSLAVEIFQSAGARGAHALDAPVSGGDVGAKNAALSIMVGGEAEAFAAVRPLFERMGRIILHQGPAGAGQHTKMCNQIVIAGSMIGVCESLLYATRAGLDPQAVLAAISKGAAGCWSLDNLAPRILKGDFAPGFMIEHFIKDMDIALEESRRMGITLPGLALVEGLYAEAARAGHGKSGTQALFLALEKLAARA